jgi:hypothetical protein
MSVKVKSVAVHHPGDIKARPSGIPHHRTTLNGPDVRNTDIEDDELRGGLDPEEANICVAVVPGDTCIGDIHVGLQFEGKKGLYDVCMRGHNDLLGDTAGMLKELFDELGGDWEVDMASQPCPFADVAVDLEMAQAILERGRKAEQEVRSGRVQEVKSERVVEPVLTHTTELGHTPPEQKK